MKFGVQLAGLGVIQPRLGTLWGHVDKTQGTSGRVECSNSIQDAAESESSRKGCGTDHLSDHVLVVLAEGVKPFAANGVRPRLSPRWLA